MGFGYKRVELSTSRGDKLNAIFNALNSINLRQPNITKNPYPSIIRPYRNAIPPYPPCISHPSPSLAPLACSASPPPLAPSTRSACARPRSSAATEPQPPRRRRCSRMMTGLAAEGRARDPQASGWPVVVVQLYILSITSISHTHPLKAHPGTPSTPGAQASHR